MPEINYKYMLLPESIKKQFSWMTSERGDNYTSGISTSLGNLFAYTPQLEKTPRYVLNFGKYSVTLNPNTTYESDNILIFSIFTHENQFDFYKPGLEYMLYDKKTKNTRILPHQKEANTSRTVRF